MWPHDEQAKAEILFFKLNPEAASGLKRTSHKLPFRKISPRSRSVEPHLGQASFFIATPSNVQSSATRPTRRVACNRSAMAGLDVMLG